MWLLSPAVHQPHPVPSAVRVALNIQRTSPVSTLPPSARLPGRLSPSYPTVSRVAMLPTPRLGSSRTEQDPQSKAHTSTCLVSPGRSGPAQTRCYFRTINRFSHLTRACVLSVVCCVQCILVFAGLWAVHSVVTVDSTMWRGWTLQGAPFFFFFGRP